MLSPQPKPEPRKRAKGRAQRAESAQEQKVRALCVLRDGDCRLSDPALWLLFGECRGESEWCHLGDNKRFKTRGMSAKDRHNTPGTAMYCTRHHEDYDQHRMDIQPVSSLGADGQLAYAVKSTIYIEEPK